VTVLGTRVDPDRATIRVDGKPIRRQPYQYLVMNKPAGFITTTSDERGRHTVMDLLPPTPGLYPVGRLDRDTEGLLLFTNDGDVANRVMHPRYGLTKEYLVQSPARPPESIMRQVRAGMEIDGKRVVPHEFRIVRETPDGALLSIVLHEGMNRVVRRIMESAGIPVSKLRRVRIGPLSIAGIPRGAHRELSPGEVSSLLQALHLARPGDAEKHSRQRARASRTEPAETTRNSTPARRNRGAMQA
jgi:23S rRNA pseudouridine2605 synthase